MPTRRKSKRMTPKPSKKVLRGLARLAKENRAPLTWYLSTDDPTVSDADTKLAQQYVMLGLLAKRMDVLEAAMRERVFVGRMQHEIYLAALSELVTELKAKPAKKRGK